MTVWTCLVAGCYKITSDDSFLHAVQFSAYLSGIHLLTIGCANYGVPHFSFPSPLPDPRASSASYYESEHGPYGVIWTQIQQDESSSSKLWEIRQNG